MKERIPPTEPTNTTLSPLRRSIKFQFLALLFSRTRVTPLLSAVGNFHRSVRPPNNYFTSSSPWTSCTVAVHPKCSAALFETRRRRMVFTTEDSRRRQDNVLLSVARMLGLYSSSHLIVPPSSWFGTFTVPTSVLDPPGESVTLHMTGVQTTDGAVNMVMTVRYTIPFGELERYLAAVGPKEPTAVIASAAATVLRLTSAEVSVGILLSRSRRDGAFMASFRRHLATKLSSDAAIQLHDISIERVEPVTGD
eukprot:gene10768-7496_t